MNKNMRQDGITLAITLVVLLIITLLGIAGMQSGIFQEEMSSNMRDSSLSFQAAETALAAGESWLMALSAFPALQTSCTSTPCVLSNDPTVYPEIAGASWWSANGTSVSTTNAAILPRYVIMYQKFVPDDATLGYGYSKNGTHYFTITVQGFGMTNTAMTILQGNIGRRF